MRKVKVTRQLFDIDKIRAELKRLEGLYPSLAETAEISLRYRPKTGTTDPLALFTEGTGPFSNYKNEVMRTEDFSQLHPLIADSYLGELFRTVHTHFPHYTLGRFRFIRMAPRTCYVWHRDNSIKFHVPVYTNPKCFFLTNAGLNRMREPGRLYMAPTNRFHTAINASPHTRVHLIICTAESGLQADAVLKARKVQDKIEKAIDAWRYR